MLPTLSRGLARLSLVIMTLAWAASANAQDGTTHSKASNHAAALVAIPRVELGTPELTVVRRHEAPAHEENYTRLRAKLKLSRLTLAMGVGISAAGLLGTAVLAATGCAGPHATRRRMLSGVAATTVGLTFTFGGTVSLYSVPREVRVRHRARRAMALGTLAAGLSTLSIVMAKRGRDSLACFLD